MAYFQEKLIIKFFILPLKVTANVVKVRREINGKKTFIYNINMEL
jgi:hypothetical protein